MNVKESRRKGDDAWAPKSFFRLCSEADVAVNYQHFQFDIFQFLVTLVAKLENYGLG